MRTSKVRCCNDRFKTLKKSDRSMNDSDLKKKIDEHGKLKGIIKSLQDEMYEGPISLKWIVDVINRFDILDFEINSLRLAYEEGM